MRLRSFLAPAKPAKIVSSFIALAVLLLLLQPAWAAKNVIIMVADGAGFNTWIATSMYQGKLGKQVYDGDGWVKLSCCTYPLNTSEKPKGKDSQDPAVVYDSTKVWDVTMKSVSSAKPIIESSDENASNNGSAAAGNGDTNKTSGNNGNGDNTSTKTDDAKNAAKKVPTEDFAGYLFLKTTYTDSAAAATAMGSGVKSYNKAINWTDGNQSLLGKTIPEIAKTAGKAAGVTTTVQWSHATPAGLGGAHNVSRDNYTAIANEMLDAKYLDVIMGAGHPEFNNNGRPAAKPNYKYVGGEETWNTLKSGTHPGGWKLVETKADFEALVSGPTPAKVLGTAQVLEDLQQKRAGGAAKVVSTAESPAAKPFARPFLDTTPTLAAIAKGAVNCLSKNPQGFFLLIEGGSVDHANHACQPDRMVEEQIDFVKTVETVVEWVNANSSWDDTLLILTADHETGFIWGPNSDKVPFEPLADLGAGNVPFLRYNSYKASSRDSTHVNSLVPLYARGAGSERFASLVVNTDKTAAAQWGFSGQYVENTSVFTVMKEAVTAAPRQKAQQVPVAAQ
jgi:alkaline phosphatase